MERGAERQREGEKEVVGDKTLEERQWGEKELQALVSVLDEGGVEHAAESRATYELISERLRRLSVARSWRECRATCHSLELQSRNPDVAADMAAGIQTMDTRPVEGWKGKVEGEGDQIGVYTSPVTIPTQKGAKPGIYPAVIYKPNLVEDGGRHWTDDEVRALLCVWANKRIRKRLKSTLRNKPIFQEMSRQMQLKFGVIRNWKQCRTKYKNLKYDYKSAKSAYAAGGGDSGGPGKYMKFFEEVECLLLDQGLENGSIDMQRRLFGKDNAFGKLNNTAAHSGPLKGPMRESVIEIPDENDSDYHIDKETKSISADASYSDHLQVVTVSDTGRNWSDQEVQALVHVWSDNHIRRQLESSTRKRDIFVQISSMLMQQGFERDWKQCHTKYKNLKYLYRSLQRGKTDDFDPRRMMRFYDQVDAIMNLDSMDGSLDDTEAADSIIGSGRPPGVEACQYIPFAKPCLTMLDSSIVGAMEETTCPDLDSLSVHDVATEANKTTLENFKEEHLDVLNYRLNCKNGEKKRDSYATSTGMKRKAVDEDLIQTPAKKKGTSHQLERNTEPQLKEEPDHIPIIMINSVCSIASTAPVTEVMSATIPEP